MMQGFFQPSREPHTTASAWAIDHMAKHPKMCHVGCKMYCQMQGATKLPSKCPSTMLTQPAISEAQKHMLTKPLKTTAIKNGNKTCRSTKPSGELGTGEFVIREAC